MSNPLPVRGLPVPGGRGAPPPRGSSSRGLRPLPGSGGQNRSPGGFNLTKPPATPTKPPVTAIKPSIIPRKPPIAPSKNQVVPSKPPMAPTKPSASPSAPPRKLPTSTPKPSIPRKTEDSETAKANPPWAPGGKTSVSRRAPPRNPIKPSNEAQAASKPGSPQLRPVIPQKKSNTPPEIKPRASAPDPAKKSWSSAGKSASGPPGAPPSRPPTNENTTDTPSGPPTNKPMAPPLNVLPSFMEPKTKKKAEEPTFSADKRLNIAREIISTESTYQLALSVMVNHYQKPITAAAETVLLPDTSKQDVSDVFSNASDILPISKMLLDLVHQVVDNWTEESGLGDIFLKMAPFYRLYNNYQNNYERAVQSLTKCQTDETFNVFVNAIDTVVKAELDDDKATVKLESLIIMPIQRIPRMILLLGELKRKTPEEHADHEKLGEAIALLDEVMTYLDKDITSEEFRAKFLDMGTKFKGASALLKAHRKLLDEGTFALKDINSSKEATGLKSKLKVQPKIRLWLFNDVLVHLKTSKSKKKTNVSSTEHTWPLQLVWLKDEPDDPIHDPKMPYSFMLVGPRKYYYIKFAEEREKKVWYSKIQKQIKEIITEEGTDYGTTEEDRFCYYQFPGKYDTEYEGWWRFGKLHGNGSFKIMGNVYKGEFAFDRKSGNGTFSSVAGEVYHGEWTEDRPNGYGQLMYTNKDRYEGEWLNGLRHGKGIHYYANGDCYDGEWAKGIQSGVGKYITTTGLSYCGSWSLGKIHGPGILIAPNGRSYQGEFKNGLKSGEGALDYGNGDSYVGQFLMDKPHGFGIFHSTTEGVYCGQFNNGWREGTGKFDYSPTHSYDGGWKKDLYHDKGTLVYPSGGLERYDGKWENGKMNGKGVCLHRGIGKLEGEFKDDKAHGSGTFSTKKNGTFFEGKWVDGRREGKATMCTSSDKYSSSCDKGCMGKGESTFLVCPDIPAFHVELT